MAPEAPDTLAEHLRRRIRAFGPLTVEAFMAEVLTHPRHGYYMTRQPFGREGDFITAPEVSQMFGELIGAWLAHTWQAMGAPTPVHLIELGPGRGTLMADLLRAAAAVAALRDAARVHLVEVSPALAAAQRQKLAGAGWTIAWHTSLEEIPAGPTLLVANELFDALPLRQFERTAAGWSERLVDIAPGSGAGFRFVRTAQPSPAAMMIPAEVRDSAPLGSIAEVSPAGIAMISAIAARVRAQGGAALVIDYGSTDFQARDTLQAVARHRTHDVLAAPGGADLCAHVDFAVLKRAAEQARARVFGPVTQRDFLQALGIEARAAALSAGASPRQRDDIAAALERLIGPATMGVHFKVLALADPKIPHLAGFP